MAAGSVLAGLAYLTYPSLGLFELIPDAVPVFGHLDEAGATTLLLLGLRYLVRGPARGA